MTCLLNTGLLPPLAGLRWVLTTRHGGVSDDGFASLNLGYHVGDDPVRVTENRRRVAAAAGYPADALIAARQVHGVRIAHVSAADRGRGALGWDDAIPDTDGLCVTEPELPAAILVADCAPVLIVDPVRRALALVHAGWRGAVGRIASAGVRILTDIAGSAPRDIRVGIGPTLCPACLEVGEEVAAQVDAAFGPAVLTRDVGNPHLDLRALLMDDLASAGVAATAVTAYPACTRCRNDLFFSHRAQHGQAGRLALIAWWTSTASSC